MKKISLSIFSLLLLFTLPIFGQDSQSSDLKAGQQVTKPKTATSPPTKPSQKPQSTGVVTPKHDKVPEPVQTQQPSKPVPPPVPFDQKPDSPTPITEVPKPEENRPIKAKPKPIPLHSTEPISKNEVKTIEFNDKMKETRRKLIKKRYTEYGVDNQGRTIFELIGIDGKFYYKYINEDGEDIPLNKSAFTIPNGEYKESYVPATNPRVEKAALKPKTAANIMFERTTGDYGTIRKGSNGGRTFSFTNTGGEPLIIKEAKASCGCVTPSYPQEPIMPGQTGVITVRYDTNRVGPFTKTVTLLTNAPNSTLVLTIKGVVVE